MDWEKWIKSPGLAPVHLDFKTKEITEAQELASEYVKLKGKSSPANYKKYDDYYSSLKVVFLEQLVTELDKNKDAKAIMTKIDDDLKITSSLDPECKQRWYPLGINVKYDPVMAPAHTFISSQGRMKYLTPIYQALLDTKQKSIAIKWFNENKNFYHPLAIDKLKKLIGPMEEKKEDKKSETIKELISHAVLI
jgi:leukotriene-A4 hydrolase